jgi:hypothetical protein
LSASAQTIEYDITVNGSGQFSDNGIQTEFSNLTVENSIFGDVTTLYNNAGYYQAIHITGGTNTYSGNTYDLTGNQVSSLFVTESPGNAVGFVGEGDFQNGMYGGTFPHIRYYTVQNSSDII